MHNGFMPATRQVTGHQRIVMICVTSWRDLGARWQPLGLRRASI
jgi:hypothetical protein